MDAEAERWWLVTQLPPLRPETKADLEILRELNADETREAREANALLTRLAGAAPYARLVDLFDAIMQALGREASAERRAAEMNRAARALGTVARDFPADLREQATTDFGAGSGELRQLGKALSEETSRAPFRLLVAVGKLEVGPFAAREDALINDPEAMAALAAEVPEVQSNTDLIRGLEKGVAVAQRLIGRQLQIYEQRINDASLHLRRLAAEAPDGSPVLMCADSFEPEAGRTNLGQTKLDPLALDNALYLHRALRHARHLLTTTNDVATLAASEISGAAPAATESAAVGKPAASAAATEREEPSPLAAEPDDRAVDADPQNTDEGPEAPPGDRHDQVLDLRALAQHATEFIDELEKAWSAALDIALLGDAHDKLSARYSSLLRSIQRRASAGDRTLRAAGFDPRVPALPLAPEETARLTLDPDLERRWRQLQLAEFDALMLLAAAFQGMRTPSARTVYMHEKRVETWWEAGAFALIRERARLLVRISEQLAHAEDGLVKEQAVSKTNGLFDRLRLAGDAFGRGDVEAALLHARLALELRAALEVESVPSDLVERLASDQRLADDAPLLRFLDQATAKLANGQELDLGAAMVAAARALPVVGRLCLDTPQIIIDAVAKESDGERA